MASISQAEKLARAVLKPTTEGSIKRKKHVEEVDPRPKPLKVSKDFEIRELLGKLYGDREFLDAVLEEAGDGTRVVVDGLGEGTGWVYQSIVWVALGHTKLSQR